MLIFDKGCNTLEQPTNPMGHSSCAGYPVGSIQVDISGYGIGPKGFFYSWQV